ncbi:MAG: nitroreductase [Bacteroidia bacterium]|jgi:nitroreductase
MDVHQLIRNRRSVYPGQYSGALIEDGIIREIMENANWAPNHYHTEPWRFIIFKNEGLKRLMKTLAEMYKTHSGDAFNEAKYQRYFARANQVSHAIVIVVEKSEKPGLPEIEEIEAVACSVQNILLTVSSTPNIGGYWSSGILVYLPEFAEFLGLKENQSCLGTVYLGTLKPNAIKPQSTRKPVGDKIQWVTQ